MPSRRSSPPDPTSLTNNITLPAHQIRARYDDETITVYQAYNTAIATAAVASQKLDASPLFLHHRMTWIKPSFCWALYRCGYTYKDKNQSHLLAITMTRAGFDHLLSLAVTGHEGGGAPVRVQWDPERDAALEKLPYRSLQLGMKGEELVRRWVDEWIVRIEDVTEVAREVKEAQEVAGRLVRLERVYEVADEEARGRLRMN